MIVHEHNYTQNFWERGGKILRAYTVTYIESTVTNVHVVATIQERHKLHTWMKQQQQSCHWKNVEDNFTTKEKLTSIICASAWQQQQTVASKCSHMLEHKLVDKRHWANLRKSNFGNHFTLDSKVTANGNFHKHCVAWRLILKHWFIESSAVECQSVWKTSKGLLSYFLDTTLDRRLCSKNKKLLERCCSYHSFQKVLKACVDVTLDKSWQ